MVEFILIINLLRQYHQYKRVKQDFYDRAHWAVNEKLLMSLDIERKRLRCIYIVQFINLT